MTHRRRRTGHDPSHIIHSLLTDSLPLPLVAIATMSQRPPVRGHLFVVFIFPLPFLGRCFSIPKDHHMTANNLSNACLQCDIQREKRNRSVERIRKGNPQ